MILDTINIQTNGHGAVSKRTTVESLSAFNVLTFTALSRMEQKQLVTRGPYGTVTTKPSHVTVNSFIY